ncbi:FxSxx-COOH system tetratricopeptide repeat protein [Phytohabitans sp. ZYX-F-186]|uniref:FxSxx-COOH system tetratricopeptide repeat protein n=1 Tax=Phytohabitans maris TaxID=3071409 RepID=A0ABU0Z855_9ACTN|nr:FxSxx-COOH system tetratricopeptide repeat protein [Phytohabitans sp. ZYX-F-186]MDQ7903251.1 FxSxx-COOH system tetratricopeptide repeat protein [Phytohabitans sp. ZYX-F-186]
MTDTRAGQIVTFYSYKGGTGRTMAVANTAWILAANGKRVLVADWDLESPGLHRFFRPFLDQKVVDGTEGIIDLIRAYEDETAKYRERPDGWYEEYARIRSAFTVSWSFPGGGSLDFLSAGRQNGDYAATLSGLDWDTFYDRLGGGQFLDALRAHMKSKYDYTLIDSRTGLSDVADICTMHLPDLLVDCFTLSDQGIEGAARVARRVRSYNRRAIQILPVPMRVDTAEKEKVDAGRAFAKRSFGGLPSGMNEEERDAYWAAVEVPYKAYYAYEETLATFADEPGSRTSLLAAFETLTGYVTGGEIRSLPPLEESVRLQQKARFVRKIPEYLDEEVVLEHAPADQLWAEWIELVLHDAGVRVRDRAASDAPAEARRARPRRLVIVSGAFVAADDSPPAREQPGTPSPLAIYVSDLRPLPEFPPETSTSIFGLSEKIAADRILRLLGRQGPVAEGSSPAGARFPGSEPRIFSAPTRNAMFTGREEELLQLRANLRSLGTTVVLQPRQTSATLPVALQGMGGVGKTQLALEYAHRFRTAYDIVWWVTAEPAQFIDTSLADLADRLGVPEESKTADKARWALQTLRRGEPFGRWLVVLDNAEDLDHVKRFLPEGNGHIIITSRNPAWTNHARGIQVDVFRRAESIEHLRQRVAGMTGPEAEQVAEVLGDLPIAIATAGAWLAETLTPVAEYLRQIERHGPRALAGTADATSGSAVEATWDLSLSRLRSQSEAAYRLLQLCSVMAPEIALDLVNSDEMAAALAPFDPSVTEPMVRAALIQRTNRLALIKLDPHNQQMAVHRLLQAVVRERMSEQELQEARRQSHRVLYASRPDGEVDNPSTWPRYRTLWPHLEASRALDSTDEKMWQLLVTRVRYLWLAGDLAEGEKFGRQVEAAWQAQLDRWPDTDEAHVLRRLLLFLRFHIGNILRSQGRFEEAKKVNEDVLEAQRELLGPQHPHTLMTARGLAADLRGLGSYSEALGMDEKAYRDWVDQFGELHPQTLVAANNLAVSYRAVGNFRDARSRDEKVYARFQIVRGIDHPSTLQSASCLGRDLREAGEYENSVKLLREVLDSLHRVLGPEAADSLRTKANLAVSLRSAGDAAAAAPLLDDAYDRFQQRFGPSNPDTLACRLSRSANLLAIGDVDRALVEMEEVADAYERYLGENHPHTLVCVTNLSAAASATGDLERALDLAQRASREFERALDNEHPYTLAAAMNLASCHAEAGDLELAYSRMREVGARMAKALGVEHPDTLCCESHVGIIGGWRGPAASSTAPAPTIARLIETIGRHHPTVRTLQDGKLVHRVLDPHPF